MKILREPLLHFMVLGALVYLAARQFDGESARYRIDAGPAQRARIATTYQQQYGTPPTERQLQYLLDQYVRSEILFREGLALGLDRDDEIVRRRVVQKIEFLNEDVAAIEASDAELERFFAGHQSRYVAPASVSFQQVFFSADLKGEGDARRRAQNALTSSVRAGDRFEGGDEFAGLSNSQAQRLFGDSQLSAALFTVPTGQWVGPFRSAFGWHLVRIDHRDAAQAPPLASVKDRVLSDYLAAERDRRNEVEFRRLASKYKIIGERSPS